MTTTSEPASPAEAEEHPTPPSPAVDATMAALHLTTKATTAYGRDDLSSRLNMAKRRLDDPAFHVLVVGEFKQGKCSLVNALLERAGLPGRRRHRHRRCPRPSATASRRRPRSCSTRAATLPTPSREPVREEIAVDQVARVRHRGGRTRRTSAGSARSRSGCPASCSPTGWCSSTRRASAGLGLGAQRGHASAALPMADARAVRLRRRRRSSPSPSSSSSSTARTHVPERRAAC